MRIRLEINKVSDETHLILRERRLTASTANEFKSIVLDLINSGDNKIILDLSAVSFLDSSGLGALVKIRKAIEPEGSLKLCSLSPQVISLFELTKIATYFEIYSNAELARAA